MCNSTEVFDTFWYEWYTKQLVKGGQAVSIDVTQNAPLFARASAIIPTKFRQRRSAAMMKQDPFTINVFCHPIKKVAKGRVYIDDYETVDTSYVDTELEFNYSENAENNAKTKIIGSLVNLPSGQEDKELQLVNRRADYLESQLSTEGLTIERVNIMGKLGTVVREITVSSWDPASNTYKPEDRKIDFRVDQTAHNVLIIKKPVLRLDQRWKLTLHM